MVEVVNVRIDEVGCYVDFFFFSSRRRHTRLQGDWSSDVCSSDLIALPSIAAENLNYPQGAQYMMKLAQDAGFTGVKLIPTSDRKSTRLNSSHLVISYAVFCLKKKNKKYTTLMMYSCI